MQATVLAFFLQLTQVSASEAHSLLHLHACPTTTTAAAPAGGDYDAAGFFPSVEAAQAAAREAIASGHTGSLVVELCPGRHPTTSLLEFGPEDVAPGGTTIRGGAGTVARSSIAECP